MFKTLKDSKDMKELFDSSLELDRRIRKLIAESPNILEIYNELENADIEYLGATEFNAYYHGFKAGLQMAVESGLHIALPLKD